MMSFALTLLIVAQGALQPGTGIVTGTLRLSGGGAAAGVRVGAVAIDDPTASSFLSVVETDSSGRYRLTNIPAGSYYIVAGRLNDLNYYPGGSDRAKAAEIVVEPARIRSGVDFTVPGGSARPPQTAQRGGAAGDGTDVRAYERIAAETRIEVKLKLLTAFERAHARSPLLAEAYVSMMKAYANGGDPGRAVEYGNMAVRRGPENVNVLVEVSRMYALMQRELVLAIQYAENAVAVVAKMKAQAGDAARQSYLARLDSGAQRNLAWVKQTAVWHDNALRALVTPRATR